MEGLESNSINKEFFDLMINLREKNNSLLLSLQEMKQIKDENNSLHINLAELENSFKILKNENILLLKKISEYQESNKKWEEKVNEINNLLNKLDINNKNLSEENLKLSKKISESEIQLSIFREKDKTHLNNYHELKSLQEEYDKLIRDVKLKKQEFSDKEDFYLQEKKKFTNLIIQYESNLKEVVQENVKFKESLNRTEKFLNLKEKEFSEALIRKENEFNEVQVSLRKISREYDDQITILNKSCEFYKQKLSQTELDSLTINKLKQMILEKDKLINKLNLEIENLKSFKHNCFQLVREIEN